jgi:hypothetical protein
MSYTIKKTNGTTVGIIADGTINNTLDITLIGKNYAGYGTVQNDNFVYLLENFANSVQPPRAVVGQLWFDTGTNKLKFLDNNKKFRTVGVTEVGATAPLNLSVGDFWYDTVGHQLRAWNGASFDLIGPQSASSTSITQMISTSVQDTDSIPHLILQGVCNSQVIFTISSDPDFTLSDLTPIIGFTKVRQGITLIYSNDDSNLGSTTSSHRFWGTSSNSERLGGFPASSFIRAGSGQFSSLVNFSDEGYTVGNPVAKLKVYNSSGVPTVLNQIGDTIQFQTTVSSVTKTPLTLLGVNILPGATNATDIGSSTVKFKNIYAAYVYSTAQYADSTLISGTTTYASATTAPTAGTVAVRTTTAQNVNGQTVSAGSLQATYFVGTATAADYADLAEKYLADNTYETGTVVSVGGDAEVTACSYGDYAAGVVSATPAHLMNSGLVGGTPIALRGRVPVKVIGSIQKGQRLTAADNGCAQKSLAIDGLEVVFAIALETNDDPGVKLVECLIL